MKKVFLNRSAAILAILLMTTSLGLAKDEEYYSLFEALSAGNVEEFKSMFEKSYNPKKKKYSININKQIDLGDGVKITFLTYAADKGNIDLVKYLVERGANVNQNTGAKNGDMTPLSVAARADNIPMMEYFLQKKAKIDGANIDGATPLMLALENGKYAAAKFLIEKKANGKVENKYGVTTVMCVITSGNKDCIKLVIDNKVDVNKKNKNGETALLLASYREDAGIIDMLVAAGAKDDRVVVKKQEVPTGEKNPVGKWKKVSKSRASSLYYIITLKPDNTGFVEFRDTTKPKGTLKWYMKGDVLVIEDYNDEGYPLFNEEQKNYRWQDGIYVSGNFGRAYFILERLE